MFFIYYMNVLTVENGVLCNLSW